MGRKGRHSGLRIGHLVVAVVVSALVLALSMFPEDYALLMVAVAGLLVIGSCVVAAIVHRARVRRARRSSLAGRKAPGGMGLFP